METTLDEMLDFALMFADRRERASKLKPICSQCGTKQIQLLDYMSDADVVFFKCRHCGHRFTKPLPTH